MIDDAAVSPGRCDMVCSVAARHVPNISMERASGETPSSEAMLAAACCRWPHTSDSAAAVSRAMSAAIDWGRFLDVVRQHRIEGLVRAGLVQAAVELPDHVDQALSGRAATIAVKNLRLAAEELRLWQAFEKAGVDLLFVKGSTGALLAYGTLALKTAWDIDLLVSRTDSDRASALLAGLGYERAIPDPGLTPRAFRRWSMHSKEMLWINSAVDIAVELHLDLFDNRQLLSGVGMGSPRQMVRHGALRLSTLASEELFAYLCVHGTIHLWARLKWLADVAAFIGSNGLDCDRLHRSSVALGAGRCGALALLLCNRFFGTHLPERLLAELRTDQALLVLERSTLAAMWRCETHAEGTESASHMLNMMAALFLMKPGWRYAVAELRYRLFFPYSPTHLSVWTWLWPLLTLLQFPRFVLKRMRLGRRRDAP